MDIQEKIDQLEIKLAFTESNLEIEREDNDELKKENATLRSLLIDMVSLASNIHADEYEETERAYKFLYGDD